MFDLCIRDFSSIINYYISYECINGDLTVHRKYPAGTADVYAKRIVDFGFSCCTQRSAAEDFVVVFTDAKGTLEFVFCGRHKNDAVVCISSNLPWCNYFHSLVQLILRDELYHDANWPRLQTMLNFLLGTRPPSPLVNSFVCPDPFSDSRWPKMEIPTSVFPHNVKYVMEYYNALALDVWVHIFTSLLLERSILFHSKRLSRLTACVVTSVSLLYPLKWVHSFYSILSRDFLPVLECPVPFVAGIHSCNLEAAQDHLNNGTCLVNLDVGSIHMFKAPSRRPDVSLHLDSSTPKAVYTFLSKQLDEVERGASLAMTSQNSKKSNAGRYEEWKKVDGEVCRFFDLLTKPFFNLIVNLLGCYTECIVGQLETDFEVDLNALISCQACPGLEQFLRLLCESQHVRLFLDTRARERPSPLSDPFEATALKLQASAAAGGRRSTGAMSLERFSQLGQNEAAPPSTVASTRKVNSRAAVTGCRTRTGSPSTNFGSAQWLRCKQMRNPGEPCHWNAKSGSGGTVFGGSLSPSSLASRMSNFFLSLQHRSSAQNRKPPKDESNDGNITTRHSLTNAKTRRLIRSAHPADRPEGPPPFPRSLGDVVDDSSGEMSSYRPVSVVGSPGTYSSEVTLDGLDWLQQRSNTLSYVSPVAPSRPKPPPRPPLPRVLHSLGNHLNTVNGFPSTSSSSSDVKSRTGNSNPRPLSTVQQVSLAQSQDSRSRNDSVASPSILRPHRRPPSPPQKPVYATTAVQRAPPSRPRVPPPPPCVSYRSRGMSQRRLASKAMSFVDTTSTSITPASPSPLAIDGGALDSDTISQFRASTPVSTTWISEFGPAHTEDVSPHRTSLPLSTRAEYPVVEITRSKTSLTAGASDFTRCDQEDLGTQPRTDPRCIIATATTTATLLGRPISLPSLLFPSQSVSRASSGENLSTYKMCSSTLDFLAAESSKPRGPRDSATLGGGASGRNASLGDLRSHLGNKQHRGLSIACGPGAQAPLAPTESHSDGQSSENTSSG